MGVLFNFILLFFCIKLIPIECVLKKLHGCSWAKTLKACSDMGLHDVTFNMWSIFIKFDTKKWPSIKKFSGHLSTVFKLFGNNGLLQTELYLLRNFISNGILQMFDEACKSTMQK